MNSDVLLWLLIAACLGSGLMAGLFCAFSTFMMKALASLPDAEGIRTMQAINRMIITPSFLLVFLGTGVATVVIAVLAAETNAEMLLFATAIIYVAACLLSTIVFNVPLNNRLDAVDANSAEGHELWRVYVVVWTRWNHLRALATVATTLMLAKSIATLGG